MRLQTPQLKEMHHNETEGWRGGEGRLKQPKNFEVDITNAVYILDQTDFMIFFNEQHWNQ